MTKKEIDAALEEVYQEMTSWRDVNKRLGYKIPQDEVSRRGLFFIAREELYKLEKAKKSRDKRAADVHEATYELLQATLGLYE
jgi:hypothetical protein